MVDHDDPSANTASPGREDGEPYHAEHDWRTDRSLSSSVIEAVSRATGTAPDRVRPLYEVIDPDALDRLFAPTDRRPGRPPTTVVSFRIEGCTVTVDGGGRITVLPADVHS